jgi:hypothetical protein
MNTFPLPLTQLIHENLSVVMMFIYSRRPLAEFRHGKFVGTWKYLDRALFDIADEKVTKALIELALFIRHLDDEKKISRVLTAISVRETGAEESKWTFGNAIDEIGTKTPLTMREVANKILHSTGFGWDLNAGPGPILICTAHESQKKRAKWVRAEIEINQVAAACGLLMS